MTFDNSTSNVKRAVGEGDDNNSHRNEMKLPVICLCTQHCVCGCEENHNKTYTQPLFDKAKELSASSGEQFLSPGSDRQFLSAMSSINGMKAMVVNGTLDNGTTADGGPPDPPPKPSYGNGAVALRNWGTFVVGLVVAAMVHL